MKVTACAGALVILLAAELGPILQPRVSAAGLPKAPPAVDDALAREKGAQLAADMLQRVPDRDLTATGKLVRRTERPKGRTEASLRMWTKVADGYWEAGYAVAGSPTNAPIELTVRRVQGKPNEYYLSTLGSTAGTGAAAAGSKSERRSLRASEVGGAFAGTDFLMMDLGLEFLNWPEQRLVGTEMRKGRACHVLESRPVGAVPGGYSRVVSWVDIEGGGLIVAEAYDASGVLFKEFAVRGVGKVGGQYEVENMEIRNLKERSRTRFELDLAEP